MLTIRCHNAADYAALPEMDGPAVSSPTEDDRACLDEVGAFLVLNSLHSRFGISLLHQHFGVTDDEVFIEFSNQVTRSVTLRPHRRSVLNERPTTPVNFRFASASGTTVGLVGLEYALQRDVTCIKPVSLEDAPYLAGVYAIMNRHARTDRFGVKLIHDELGLKDDEVLLETCDVENRSLNCSVMNRFDHAVTESIETFWIWNVTLDSLTGAYCRRQSCQRHCWTEAGRHAHRHDRPGCN